MTNSIVEEGRKIIKQTDFQQKSRTTEKEDRHLEERKSMRKSTRQEVQSVLGEDWQVWCDGIGVKVKSTWREGLGDEIKEK